MREKNQYRTQKTYVVRGKTRPKFVKVVQILSEDKFIGSFNKIINRQLKAKQDEKIQEVH